MPSPLRQGVAQSFPDGHPSKAQLAICLGDSEQDTDMGDAEATDNTDDKPFPVHAATLPEVEIFLHTLVIVHLIDAKAYDRAITCATLVSRRMGMFNRHMLELISAKAWFYYARTYEMAGQMSTIRPTLLGAYRTACLHHNVSGQEMLINLLLRNYLAANQVCTPALAMSHAWGPARRV